jgi:hypothetical protein
MLLLADIYNLFHIYYVVHTVIYYQYILCSIDRYILSINIM